MCEVVVCLDKQSSYQGERFDTIMNSRPQAFYSQVVNWDTIPNFKKITFQHHYPVHECKLDSERYEKSYCSPFVACQVAYRDYNATEIHLFGVDLVGHPNLKPSICAKIKVHFKNLAFALDNQGCKLIVHGDGILKDI